MTRRVRAWLIGLSLLSLLVLAAVLLIIWVAGQIAGALADRWPPVSYPLGALGELGAVLTHPRSAIGPGVPTAGFWLYLAAELGAIITVGMRVLRGRRRRLQPSVMPTVVSGAARDGDRFLHAYDQVALRDADR